MLPSLPVRTALSSNNVAILIILNAGYTNKNGCFFLFDIFREGITLHLQVYFLYLHTIPAENI